MEVETSIATHMVEALVATTLIKEAMAETISVLNPSDMEINKADLELKEDMATKEDLVPKEDMEAILEIIISVETAVETWEEALVVILEALEALDSLPQQIPIINQFNRHHLIFRGLLKNCI
jgi:hypothetical protein